MVLHLVCNVIWQLICNGSAMHLQSPYTTLAVTTECKSRLLCNARVNILQHVCNICATYLHYFCNKFENDLHAYQRIDIDNCLR